MLYGCPTPSPAASSEDGPPRSSPNASHTLPLHKRKPLHTPPAEITPVGRNQFRFTRAESIERSSRPSSISGHAYAGMTSEDSENNKSSDEEEGEGGEEDNRPRVAFEGARFELEELDSDEADDEGVEVVKPDQWEDAESDRSEACLETFRGDRNYEDYHASELWSKEDTGGLNSYLRREKERLGWVDRKRDRNEGAAGDSDYSDPDHQDGKLPEARRRLRRKLGQRWPWDRSRSLIFEDKGFPNTNNIIEEEEEEGVLKHTKGPPSIPSDDAFTLDEMPYSGREGTYSETMEVESLQEQMESMSDDADYDRTRHVDVCAGADSSTDPHASKLPGGVRAASVDQGIEDIEDDRRSIVSTESSTTLVSTLSGLTEVELENATMELQNIFQGDAGLIELYHRAIKDTTIGPERLQRNIGRLLRLFARDLRREASEELQKKASNFVLVKASFIAQCIIEKYNDRKIESKLQTSRSEKTRGGRTRAQELGNQAQEGFENRPVEDREIDRNQNEIVADQYEGDGDHPEFEAEQLDDDDLDRLAPIDEDYFEDLLALRAFLVDSTAFQTFRKELTKFVLPKELRAPDLEPRKENFTIEATPALAWSLRRILGLVFCSLRSLLLATGCLDQPLQPGMIRLRWQCKCGDMLYSDAREYQEGGIAKLIDQLQPTASSIVTVTRYDDATSKQQYRFRHVNTIRRTFFNAFNALSRMSDVKNILPWHIESDGPVAVRLRSIGVSYFQDIVLLGCVLRQGGGKGLRQDSIGNMSNSRQLFSFIQREYWRMHAVHGLLRCLRKVKSIQLTKFYLRLNNDVEPRLHERCCREDACQCIPTMFQYEYGCTPKGPPEFGPPILPEQMLHYFMHPELIDEEETTILDQIPKRMCGRLEASGNVLTEGWGLYYEEGWDIAVIVLVTAGIAILASLLFGVCWTTSQNDIQGAWGVSSYIVTTGALIVALLSMVGSKLP